ncbi:HDOD domain-containing protein [Thalassolituus marinus]|uniref:HDOD domain-containing protein n=1 Tax=Thalassolituus marinus TaxID=671053 RepID=A0ABS7ZQ45_9GAMM|nr:HDOD domain-containing protein [Thalassolituus marinus]MCA6063823.1 HDOD domain-containing protein [Thalassolituus marinus]
MSMATIFAETQQLPHIPRVVQELIESFRNEDVDVDELSSKVALDQSLTAKVLRLANSAHYGVSRTIANPHDAIMLLGFNTLRTMVLASGMTSAFKAPDNFDMKTFWRDSFAVGALSKWLANYVDGCDRETAFTCGMLHSVGELLIRMVMPKEARHIDEALSMGGTRHTLERGQLGFTSADVGAELAKRWKFPAEMQQAILEQNNPDLDRTYSALAGILHIAQYLNKAHKDGLDEEAILAKFPKAVADAIGMNCDKAYADLADSNDLSSGLEGLLE